MILENKILRLRALEPEDLEFLYSIENDVSLWSVSSSNIPYSHFALKQYIAQSSSDIFADKGVRLIAEKKETGEMVGIVDLYNLSLQNRRVEVGIVVKDNFRNHGYASSMLSLVIEYASKQLYLHQIYAYVLRGNKFASNLFRSVHFKEVACIPDWKWAEGKYNDVLIFQYFLNP